MRSELPSRLGRAIKQLRLERAITQQELANRAKLHRTYISDVERGTRNLTITCLDQIAAALESPLSEIFKRVEAAEDLPFENKTPARSDLAGAD